MKEIRLWVLLNVPEKEIVKVCASRAGQATWGLKTRMGGYLGIFFF